MPSDLSYWLISVPLHDGDPATVLTDVRKATSNTVEVGGWDMPDLKVCHLMLGVLTVDWNFVFPASTIGISTQDRPAVYVRRIQAS